MDVNQRATIRKQAGENFATTFAVIEER